MRRRSFLTLLAAVPGVARASGTTAPLPAARVASQSGVVRADRNLLIGRPGGCAGRKRTPVGGFGYR